MPVRPVIRSTIIAFATAGALALSLAACTPQSSTGAGSSDSPVRGGTLTYASGDAEPTCLDPHVGGNYPQALVATQYLEELVSKNTKGQIIPWLATKWTESKDGLSWDFTLRDGVKFTDGTPLDAAAVKANVAHIQDPATGSSTGYLALGKVASTEIVSPRVIRFTLSQPDSALLESLTQPWLAIESPAALKRSKDVNCAHPVGTGPFIVKQWKKQDSITLVRNAGYTSPPADAAHHGPAYLSKIVWRFIPDSATRYAALKAGEVDVIDNAQPDTIVAAHKTKSLTELNAPRPGASNRIELNSGKAPFNDEKVREAFIRAADVNDGIKTLFFGTAKRSYSALSSVEPLGYSEPGLFGYEPKKANELLDAAGYTTRDADGYRTKDGTRLTVVFPVSTNQSIPAEQSLFEQIQATTKKVGFDVKLEPMDLSSWYAALAKNDYDAVSAPYTKVGPDVLRILYDSASITPAPSGYFANLAQVDIPSLDATLEKAAQVSDVAERSALYETAQKTILEGYYILPLYDQQNHYLLRNDVVGLRALPSVSTPLFYDTWLDR
ncbi:ABC transporter substrate-binding protein [Microbacterium sp. STN6]|uniref:ABC transporter substrate-binding protein n=1 Tax=Microbacterium sp. STN6 TaxID=2995588 RepID=UPI002260B890|nr:ABC transporter substrate-binding protein [Microbacterium sp. STN6]MCX7522229.1 ABC transporter substrate-binding protein [Microbacterium sp. STN6]